MIVNAIAPVRICDIGGWTDTWFAEHGSVLNLAVTPGVEVQIETQERARDDRVTIRLENYGDTYSMNPDAPPPGRHPLLEEIVQVMGVPEELAIDVAIYSEVPPGASVGTSAAVSVAFIVALHRLLHEGFSMPPEMVAHLAHKIETERLGLQCGVQDQIACAYGGVNLIDVQYPASTVSRLKLAPGVAMELERRLTLVYVGAPHESSRIHDLVIEELSGGGADDDRIAALRELPGRARHALAFGIVEDFGAIMDENTEIQRALHPGLVCDRFEEVMSIARDFDALGCKVNGAGGDGGSVTILSDGISSKRRAMVAALKASGVGVLDVRLSDGAEAWRTKRIACRARV